MRIEREQALRPMKASCGTSGTGSISLRQEAPYEKKKISFVVGIGRGVVLLFYIGAMFDFFPFIADDLVIRALGFCTLIICLVIAVCTCFLADLLDKK